MATKQDNLISLVADVDFTDLQYRFGKVDTAGEITTVAATTDVIFGIVQNTPVTGESAAVAPISGGGTSYIELGDTVATGVNVGTDSVGRAVAVAATGYSAGILTKGGAVGEIGEIRLGSIVVTA